MQKKAITNDNNIEHRSIREVAATNNLRADLSSCLNMMVIKQITNREKPNRYRR